MTNAAKSTGPVSTRDRHIQLGLLFTALWLGAGVLYVATSWGWTALSRMPSP
jgi:hypothetical protein